MEALAIRAFQVTELDQGKLGIHAAVDVSTFNAGVSCAAPIREDFRFRGVDLLDLAILEGFVDGPGSCSTRAFFTAISV